RKPVLNKLKHNILNVLCIEIERFKVRLTVLDNNNNKHHAAQSYPFSLTKDQSSLTDLLHIIDANVATSKINWDTLVGIGISMPGHIHGEKGENYTYLLAEQDERSLKNQLTERFNKPVLVINDVKSSAVAELNFGLAKRKKDVLVIL